VSLVAGLDVGNTTTEVVIADTSASPPAPVAWDRQPTRGHKGSDEALRGAAALVRRLERRTGRPVDAVVATSQRPVVTATVSLPRAAPQTGRLEVVPVRGSTPGGQGTAVGTPVRLDDQEPAHRGPVVLLVPSGFGFQAAAHLIGGRIAAGDDVRGVLVADDEGVLVAARLPAVLPICDEVDVDRLTGASLVAVEVRAPGHPLRDLVDPIRLSALLGLPDGERADAAAVAGTLEDASRAVVAVRAHAHPASPGPRLAVTFTSGEEAFELSPAELATRGVGGVAHLAIPGQVDWAVDDLWAVELRELATSTALRLQPSTARALVVAALHAEPAARDPRAVLEGELGAEVLVVASEPAAARAGALSTPRANPGATVVDLGGGTVDVIGPEGRRAVAAGAGEMLTATVSTYLGVPRGAADWIKRGPCVRLEAPHVVLAEDGSRTFTDESVAREATGSLAAPGPAGLLAFGADMAPAEWRALRIRAKERVLVDNVVRALRTLDASPAELVLVGGAAADEELLTLVRRAVPGAVVGRADVAGRLGHRHAVAYGLLLLAGDQPAATAP